MQNSALFTDTYQTTPYWWEAAPPQQAASDAMIDEIDILIIGSGYTGLSAALTLGRAGREVAVVEAEQIGFGASSRNAGFVGKTLKHSFSSIAEKHSLPHAIAVYREAQAAFDYVCSLIQTENMECHFVRCGRFMAALSPSQYEMMARELELKEKHLGDEFEMVTPSQQHQEICSDGYHGGAVIPQLASLHPALYHQQLLERVTSMGVDVISGTRVNSIRPEGGGFVVTTDRGAVHAHHVIAATNGYTTRAVSRLYRRVVPFRGYMIATESLDPERINRILPTNRTVHDYNNNLLYMRRAPDSGRLLIGGLTGCGENDVNKVASRLHRKLSALFEDMRDVRIDYAWQGFGAATFDLYPHIGHLDGIRYAMGYCFAGVPMATYLGHKVALQLLGDEEGDTLFNRLDFSTRFYYWGSPWFVPLAMRLFSRHDIRR